MSEDKNPTNDLKMTGQVLGVYPAKGDNRPNSYLFEFRTGFLYNGRMVPTEARVFVNTMAQLPEENDVLEVTGLLNIYSSQNKDGSYETRVGVTERDREYVGKGRPRERKQKNVQRGKQTFNNNRNSNRRQRNDSYEVNIDEQQLDTIDY